MDLGKLHTMKHPISQRWIATYDIGESRITTCTRYTEEEALAELLISIATSFEAFIEKAK
jgi:hypothetical protein